MGRGWGGAGDGWEWGGGGIKELTTNMISAAIKKNRCLLLCGVSLAACCGGWVSAQKMRDNANSLDCYTILL